MAKNTVEYVIKITDKASGMMTQITGKAKDFEEVLSNIGKIAKESQKSIVNWSQASVSFGMLRDSIGQIDSYLTSLTEAYADQIGAETRLATAMRNTMNASDAEIEYIKALAASQQQLGIVGDEVQLAGAQELSTYLGLSSSLEKLLPVMNDMVAQQYGFNASQEAAVNIATMMGKVMEGQTGALSRYGYSFTEAQEQILKFGTEAEKATVLAEVVEESVGGMNEAMAKTPYGKLVQFKNTIGDIKEKVGEFTPFIQKVSMFANTAIKSLSNIGQIVMSVKAAGNAILTMFKSLSAGISSVGKAIKLLGIWTLAISAVATAITVLTKRHQEEKQAAKEALEAEKGYLQAQREAAIEIDIVCQKIKNFNGTREEETKMVEELNSRYGDTFGTFNTLSQWYDVLIAKSEIYARKIANEAKVRRIADQLAEKEGEAHDLRTKADSLAEKTKNSLMVDANGAQYYEKTHTNRYYRADKEATVAENEVKELNIQLQAAVNEGVELNRQLKEGIPMTTPGVPGDPSGNADTPLERISLSKLSARIAPSSPVKAIEQPKPKAYDNVAAFLGVDLKEVTEQITDTVDALGPCESIMEKQIDSIGEAQNALAGLGDGFQSLGDIIGGQAESWLDYGASVVQAIGQALPAIASEIAIIKAKIQVKREEAEANAAAAITGAASSMAGIPVVGVVLALAGIASIAAALANMPKFAKGGIAYGPTIGMFGEYAGASNNPEVVAPLSRLRSLLQPSGTMPNNVQFKIRGRDLIGFIDTMNRFEGRTV